MPLDFTAWPGLNDVADRLTAAGITQRLPQFTDRQGAMIAAVIAEIGQRTQRQWEPGPATEVRYYNGTGTAEQEVDEMVSLTSVGIVGLSFLPVYTLNDAALVYEQGRPRTRIVVAQGSVPALTSEGVFLPYPWYFPAGRQNIAVTGSFGYGATIPADLWEAACGEMAYRLASEAMFVQSGRLQSWGEDGVTESYKIVMPDAIVWHDVFEAKMVLYKRPNGRRLRNMRNKMIV